MSREKHPVGKATARIDWRKLLVPSLLIMVLPTVSALLLDRWLGTLPLVTIVVMLITFPLATFLVIRIALQEMDRVIAEVAPEMPYDSPMADSPEAESLEEQELPLESTVEETVKEVVDEAADSQDGSSSTT